MKSNETRRDAAGERGNRRRPGRRWLRWVAWFAASLAVLVVAVGVGLIALVNAGVVHRYLIRLAQRKASEALGVQVKLENYALRLPTLSLDLYGVRISGANPHSSPPLLEADHIGVGIRIVSVIRRSWYLDHLQIDHPVARVVIDKNGISNLPKLKSSGSTHTDVFELGIRHAVLDRGEVYYNDRPISLAADLHNLEFRASFSSLRTRYNGKLSYTDGKLEYGSYRPFQHDFDAEFEATPSAFTLTQARIRSGASQAIVSAVLKDYNSPGIQAKYIVTVDGRQLARLLHELWIEEWMPAGKVQAAGSLQYQQAPNRSTLQRLAVDGDLTSSRLIFNTSAAHGEVRSLAAHYSLANGDATLRDLRADLLGGELTARGAVRSIGGDSHSSFHAELHRVSLAELRKALGGAAAVEKNIGLTGQASATATATWGEAITGLVAHVDASVTGKVQRSHTAGRQIAAAGRANTNAGAAIPFDGLFHALYENGEQELKLDHSYLRSSQTNLDLNGTVSEHSSLSVRLQANDLGEIASIVDLFRAPGNSRLGLAGKASFQGAVEGSTAAPRLAGQLVAENLRFDGTAWRVLRTGIEVSPSQVALQNADIEPAGRGRITCSASAGLQKWSFTEQSPIQVILNASQIDAESIAKLAGPQIPITGTLSARVNVHGDAMNPSGNGSVTLTNATAYAEPISLARVDFTGSGNQAAANLRMQIDGGTIESRITVELRQRTFTAELNSTGIELAKLQILKARNIGAKSALGIQARGQGSFNQPEINANVDIPGLTIGGQSISGIKLQMNVANHVAQADLVASIANVPLHAKARVGMSGDYLTEASLDTQTLPLQPFLAVYAPEQAANASGRTEIHATLHGPLKRKDQLEARVTIPVLEVGYRNTVELRAASPIEADFKNGVFDIQPATIRGTDTDLELQGSIPIRSGAPMSLKAQGTVNLQLAQLFDPDLHTSGELKFNIDSHGAVGSGELGGEIDVVDANLSSTGLPVGLQNGNGVLKLTTDRVEVTKFAGTVGGGDVTAQGAIVYRPKMQFAMGATVKGVRMLYPQGVRETVDANLRLAGSTGNAVLGGSVSIADLSFTPAFDLDTLVSQFSGGVSAPVEQGFGQNLALNIALNSTSTANLVSRTVSVGGSANLQIRGTAADPVVLGRVNLSGGDIILHGDRFVLTGGTVQFINPSMTQPVLNVSLTTTIQQYKIDLRFNGTADQLHAQYTSDPALPSADIISLLAFGQTTEASAANPTPANQQAESLVASQVSSQVTSRISKAAGISQLSISPVLQGGTAAGPPGANLTIQQRVTGNLFVTFSTNLATTQNQIIQGQYQISPRVAVSATRDPNGGFAVDTLIKNSW